MACQNVQRVEVVHGNTEEAVHLRRMERHREHAAGAGRVEQVRHEPRRNGDSWRVLFVRSCISEIGDHGRRASSRCAPGRIQHLQQFHQMIVNGHHKWLYEKHIGFPAVGLQLHLDAAVAELVHRASAGRDAQVDTDVLGQLRVRRAAKHRDITHGLHSPFGASRPLWIFS